MARFNWRKAFQPDADSHFYVRYPRESTRYVGPFCEAKAVALTVLLNPGDPPSELGVENYAGYPVPRSVELSKIKTPQGWSIIDQHAINTVYDEAARLTRTRN